MERKCTFLGTLPVDEIDVALFTVASRDAVNDWRTANF
jgi:hypothetical protein